jgi:hypothetical protein
MTLRFLDRIVLDAGSPLTDSQRAQLAVIGPRYFGGDGPARLAAPDEDIDDDPEANRALGYCKFASLVDGERACFDAWLYMVDSGTVFVAGTTQVVAQIIQFGIECDDPALRRQLGMAMVEAKLLPVGDQSYSEFAALLAARP